MGSEDRNFLAVVRRRGHVFGLLAGATLVLAACSSVPDAANPAHWYRSTVDFFSGEDEVESAAPAPADTGERFADSDKSFPSLADVPERPRVQPAEGLVADTRGRRYASEAIERQGEAANTLADADMAPPPPAVPTSPVDASPLVAETAPAPVAPSVEPTPATMAAPAPVPAMNVMDAYQAALAQTRPGGTQGRDVQSPSLDFSDPGAGRTYVPGRAVYQPGFGAQDFGTVVIGGGGIETHAAAFAPTLGSAPVSTQGMVKVATIMFGVGSSSLDANDRRILAQVRDLQNRYGGRLVVVGHASSRTANMSPEQHRMVNYRVSAERAEAVVAELQRQGATQGAVMADARGDAEPIYYEVMPSGETGNRRAEIYLAQ